MKKTALLFLMVGLIFQTYTLWAEESSNASTPATSASKVAATESTTEPAPVTSSATPEALQAPEVSPVPQPATAEPSSSETAPPAVVTAARVNPAPAASENLEFVSGEITSTDVTAKTMTVKLYGETENAVNDKTLTVKLDETADITDGEKDRDIKSLTNGTEVDVEYDPATNKATYIFVY